MAKEWEVITKTNFWGQKSYEVREKDNSGGGCLILLLIIVGILVFAFTAPYRLIERNFDVWEFDWIRDVYFWLYCLSAWILLMFSIIMIRALWTFSKFTTNAFQQTFDSPLSTLGIFAATASYFTAYLVKILAPDFLIHTAAALLLLIGLLYFFLIKESDNPTKTRVLVLVLICVIAPCLWIANADIPRYGGSTEETAAPTLRNMVISANTVANIRSHPTTDSRILYRASKGMSIEVVLDSAYTGNSLWYKVQLAGVEGWVNGSLVRWE